MAEKIEVVEIDGIPELVRITADVRASNAPRLLRHAGRDVALLVPLGQPRGADLWSDYDPHAVATALNETLGSWADLDADAVIARIHRARVEGTRPASRP